MFRERGQPCPRVVKRKETKVRAHRAIRPSSRVQLTQVKVVDAKLRGHKLVQQRAEQGGERDVLASVDCRLLLGSVEAVGNLGLQFFRRKEYRHRAQHCVVEIGHDCARCVAV